MGVLDDLPRGVPHLHKRPKGLPGSKWAVPSQIASDPRYIFTSEKIFCGIVEGQLTGIKDDRHAMLVAGSRAGKGRNILIPTLLEYAGSTLVVDPKAELAGITARRRGQGGTRADSVQIEGLGQEVAVLDPFGIGESWLEPYKASFNPMEKIFAASPTFVEDAAAIADALVVRSADEKDPHWNESALQFLQSIIAHVATAKKYEGKRNLVTVNDLVAKALDMDERLDDNGETIEIYTLEEEMLENESGDGFIIAGAASFFDRTGGEQSSVLSTTRRHLGFIDAEGMRKNLAGEVGQTVDLSELKKSKKGMTIYLCLPATKMATHGRWFRLLINSVIEEMGRTPGRPQTGLQTLFILDEFHVLGNMKVIATAAALMAGHPYHVKLFTVLQDLSQLKYHYDKQWETFVGNAGIVIFFGNTDSTTLNAIKDRLGKTPVLVEKGSDVSDKAAREGAISESWSYEVHDLLSPPEIACVFRRNDEDMRCLLFDADSPDPIILQRVNYDEMTPVFGNKYDILTE